MKINNNDPIEQVECVVREVNNYANKHTRHVLHKYPLSFAFLTVFSFAAILHGFDLVIDRIWFFQNHPSYLIIAGALLLFITGSLYKTLERISLK